MVIEAMAVPEEREASGAVRSAEQHVPRKLAGWSRPGKPQKARGSHFTPEEPKIVTEMPLKFIWDASGLLGLARGRYLNKDDIADLLRRNHIRLVVASCGQPLAWVPSDSLYRFWKEEVKPRLVDPALERWRLEDYPGEYCYLATEWTGDDRTVVLLEVYH